MLKNVARWSPVIALGLYGLFAIVGLLAVSSVETLLWLDYGLGWPTFQLALVTLASIVLWAHLKHLSPRSSTVATVALALLFLPYVIVVTFLMFYAAPILPWLIGFIVILVICVPLAVRLRRNATQ